MFDPIWFHLVPVRFFFLVWSSLGCGFPFSRGGLVKRDAKACMSRHRAWVLFRFFRGDAKSLAWVPRWLVKREAKACVRDILSFGFPIVLIWHPHPFLSLHSLALLLDRRRNLFHLPSIQGPSRKTRTGG